tara:strand:+ start:2594 stop:3142 length:549 start_codon:yes stop_codon:yes gene_type:complete
MDNNTLKWLVAGVAVYLLFIKRKETPPSPPTPTPIVDDIPGCTDPTADNYSDVATIDDGSCIYQPVTPLIVTGCTDPLATNYDPLATDDDGSCVLPVTDVMGCTDSLANNYNALATTDDGSCTYTEVDCWSGCPTPAMVPSVQTVCPATHPNLSEPSCIVPITGCQDALAVNYNPNATQGCS